MANSTVSVKSNHRLTVFTFSFGLTFDAFCFGACFTTASSGRSAGLQCPTVTLQAVRDLHDANSTRRVEIKRRPSETSSRSRCLVLPAPEHVVIFISVCGDAIEAGVSSQSRSTAVFPSTFPCFGATDSSPSSCGSDNRASLKASWSDVLVRIWYPGHLAWRAPKPSSRASRSIASHSRPQHESTSFYHRQLHQRVRSTFRDLCGNKKKSPAACCPFNGVGFRRTARAILRSQSCVQVCDWPTPTSRFVWQVEYQVRVALARLPNLQIPARRHDLKDREARSQMAAVSVNILRFG